MKTGAYLCCQAAADAWGSPHAGLHYRRATYVGPEVDQWISGLPAWMVMSLLQPDEDFTLLSDEGQRMFLALAGEVLFGKRADGELWAECHRIATEPI